MIEVRETDEYADFVENLRDDLARAKITARITRLAGGNPGDVKPVGDGISEMRIHHGPGYRVYYIKRGGHLNHSFVRGRQVYAAKRH